MFALAACFPPTTSRAVGSTVGFKSDPSLEGLWRTQPDPGGHKFLYYHLLDTKNGTMFALVVPDRGGEFNVAILKFSTVRSNNFGFPNVRFMMDPKHELPDQSPGTLPVLNRFDAKGKLAMYIPDERATVDANCTHKIAGTIDDGMSAKHASLITADAPTLAKFFSSPVHLVL